MLDDALGLGFRTTNMWLNSITGGMLSPQFYAGDALGSFNWWARLITGLVAGFAFAFQVYSQLDQGFASMANATTRDRVHSAPKAASDEELLSQPEPDG